MVYNGAFVCEESDQSFYSAADFKWVTLPIKELTLSLQNFAKWYATCEPYGETLFMQQSVVLVGIAGCCGMQLSFTPPASLCDAKVDRAFMHGSSAPSKQHHTNV